MHKLEQYVGRIVRLKQQTYERILKRSRALADSEENCFLVAAIDRQMRRLVCYGGNHRIAVCPTEIVLV